MFVTVRIRRHELGLWMRNGDFHKILQPGKYRVWSRLYRPVRDVVTILNTLHTRFDHPQLDVLVKEPDVARELTIVDLDDSHRALVWKDGRLMDILGPGRYAYFNRPYNLSVETFDVDNMCLEHPRIDAIVNHLNANKFLQGIDVDDYEEVLLFRDGVLVRRLTRGRYIYWKGAGRITWKAIDRREQVLDISGQEIMTRDKVTLRLNLIVTYRVADALKAVGQVNDYAQALYREGQLALRAVVGTRTLDALLTDKDAIGNEVNGLLATRASEFGLSIRSVGLRDVILPGDMKVLMNQVIEAEKAAQANLIRRREETAAARSQANTARLLSENPVLARMKEYEAVAEIMAGTKATFVLGGGDLAEQVRRLVGPTDGDTS